MDWIVLQSLLVAFALGALIGLEREYARYHGRGHDFAGIRTFPLIGLFGALSAYLGEKISPYILIVGMLLVGVLIIMAYLAITRRTVSHLGTTSEVAAFLTFFIGVLAYNQEYTFAATLAIFITIILFARSMLHHLAERITKKEIGDTLKFVIVAFLILPFLPDQGYGPGGFFNPYLFWLMVVFISGIGFVGYTLMKWFGERGITLTGIFGGLASSTATTLSLAERSRRGRKIFRTLALGVILANGVMFIRVLVEVFVLNRSLLDWLLFPLLFLTVVTAACSYFVWKKIKHIKTTLHLSSPFALAPALKFALLFILILALTKGAYEYFSSGGIYLASFLSGIADVDAITLSLAQLAQGELSEEVAGKGILLAVLSNILFKGGMAYFFGGKEFRQVVLSVFAVLLVLGLVMVALV